MPKMGIGVQLYTLRDLLAKDFPGTVRQVAKIGYRNVEMAGYGSLKSAREARKALDDAGLRVVGNHAGISDLEKNLGKVLDDNEALGNKTVVLSWMPEDRRKNAEGWKSAAQTLNRIAADCQKRGCELAYHNHSFEFEKFNGAFGLDLLFNHSDPRLVKAELDVFWIQHGGEDPVAYIRQFGPRTLILHLKDMANGPERQFAEVGTGILDFTSILAAAEKAGVRWGIVEQDTTYGRPPLDCIRTSFENLKNLGAV